LDFARDDWDVYYKRGRKPKESVIKYEAARSKGDYRRKVLLARVSSRCRNEKQRAQCVLNLNVRETFITSVGAYFLY
jgi:hypothetical protein